MSRPIVFDEWGCFFLYFGWSFRLSDVLRWWWAWHYITITVVDTGGVCVGGGNYRVDTTPQLPPDSPQGNISTNTLMVTAVSLTKSGREAELVPRCIIYDANTTLWGWTLPRDQCCIQIDKVVVIVVGLIRGTAGKGSKIIL